MNQTISELTSRALDVITESAGRLFITGLLTGATVVFVISRKVLLRLTTELKQLRTELSRQVTRNSAILSKRRDKRAKAAAAGTRAARQ